MKYYSLSDYPSLATMRELVDFIDSEYGNDTAYSFRLDPHDSDVQKRSFSRLASEVRSIGNALAARSICEGVHCALIGKLTYGWVRTYLALLSVGAVLVPLDPEWSAKDLADTVNKAECRYLFCSDEVYGSKATEIVAATNAKAVITIDSAESDLTLHDLMLEGELQRNDGSRAYESARISPDKTSLLVFTSGTTGQGKGVMLSQTAILSDITITALRIIKAGKRTVGVLPPHHTFGSTVNILGNLLLGVDMYISSGIRYLPRELKEHKPEHLIVVPLYLETFYRRILAGIKDSGKEKAFYAITKMTDGLAKVGIDVKKSLLKSVRSSFGGELRFVISGGAPLSSEIASTFKSLGIDILNGYGITECAPLLSVNLNKCQKEGSVGMPIPGVKIKIRDANEDGEGEILAKGPNVMLGYYKDEEATRAAFDEDGYFCTGDIGKLDSEGWIYITGRAKNLIILSNGKNVYPEEIETELSSVPGVIDVVVYEGISRRGGEHNAIVAEIYPDYDFLKKNNVEDKQEYFRKYVSDFNRNAVAYKKISVLKVRETEFPKNTLRKITRFKIDKTID